MRSGVLEATDRFERDAAVRAKRERRVVRQFMRAWNDSLLRKARGIRMASGIVVISEKFLGTSTDINMSGADQLCGMKHVWCAEWWREL